LQQVARRRDLQIDGCRALTIPDSRRLDPGSSRDTIAAIATAPAPGGIGVIRISGPEASVVARKLAGPLPPPRQARFVALRDDAGELLDKGLLLFFAAPNSYTGEDVVELQLHGSPPLLQRVLRRVLALGARLARPGEFTERAFLEGKLDLAQAEAVADLIAAGSETAARAALRSLDGAFSTAVDALLQALVALRVHVEAAIDFPEEEIDFLGDGQIAAALDGVLDRHAALLGAARRGQRLRDGLHVVIAGPPNAGKSSLLNALAGSERAIVTAIAGTTRDLLRETVQLDGIELTLVDTAGLRVESHDPIEHEGMRRARAERTRADVVLAVVECNDDQAQRRLNDELAQDMRSGAPRIIWLHSKSDLHGIEPGHILRDGVHHLWLSTSTGAGLPALIELLRQEAGIGGDAGGAFSARTRHVDALERTGAHLARSEQQLRRGAGELVAEELRMAQQALGEITGAFAADDLLGEIFGSFCIGK
jgi:tRNA modification GTPase